MDIAVHIDGRVTRHEDRRPALLDAAADYVLAHGVTHLSIRPLAAALGLSHRTLLYHFESKDKLIVEVLDVIRARDQGRIRDFLHSADLASSTSLFRAAWAYFSAPERTAYNRFLHEVLALGLRDGSYRAWVQTVVDGRTDMVAAALVGLGIPAARARAAATLTIASVRGLQLHLLLTGDRALTDAAFEEHLSGLQSQLRPSRES